jgi:hypothetical protein
MPGRRILAGVGPIYRRGLRAIVVVVMCSTPFAAAAQDSIAKSVRTAMTPALPFPETDADGALPKNGDTEALWMVRPLEPEDHTIEVVANPLNQVNQLKAARAMAQIEANVEAAQRRAAAQFDRAVAEAKRTGKSQDIDGVTLADEGIAGAKIDADSHVTIDVDANRPAYKFTIESSTAPELSAAAPVAGANLVSVAASVFHDDALSSDRYAEAQAIVFLGRVTPQVQKRADHSFDVAATAADNPLTIVIRMRGNETLIADLLRKTDWNALQELLK